MRIAILATGLGLAVLVQPWAAAAQDAAVPGYLEGVASQLQENGYRHVRLVDTAARRIVAFDRNGSEVALTIHPRNGSISSLDYVRSHDR